MAKVYCHGSESILTMQKHIYARASNLQIHEYKVVLKMPNKLIKYANFPFLQ